jgi:hypothetical protein
VILIDAMGAVLLGLEFLGCLHMQAKNPGASVAENDNNHAKTIHDWVESAQVYDD